MNGDTFDIYAEYRLRGEDEECTRLRMRLPEPVAGEFEAAYRDSQEARAAA